MLHAQVVTTGQWNTMVAPTKDGTPFWDGASSDNVNGSNCNVGYFLLNQSGAGFGPCINEHPTDAFVNANAGRLGYTGNNPNGSFLSGSNVNTSAGFAFKAGTYRLEFLANISGFGPSGQELWAYSGPSSAPLQVQQLYAVGSYPDAVTSVFNVTFNTEWYLGARTAEVGHPWMYSNSVATHYALFSERAVGNVSEFGRFWVGFGDTPSGGDNDYNDLMLQVQQVQQIQSVVPEPSTWALMVFGLGSLGLVSRRRQRNR